MFQNLNSDEDKDDDHDDDDDDDDHDDHDHDVNDDWSQQRDIIVSDSEVFYDVYHNDDNYANWEKIYSPRNILSPGVRS